MIPTGLASAAQIYHKLLEIYGLDATRFLHEAGLSAEVSEDPDARVPVKALDTLLIYATAQIPDEAWGLQAARCWHPGNLGVLGHAWLACATLRTGLTRVVRYWRILGERAATRIEDTADGLKFAYDLKAADPVVEAVMPDCILSIAVDMCRINAGSDIRPLRVTLRRKRPADPEPWTAFFWLCGGVWCKRERICALCRRCEPTASDIQPSTDRHLRKFADRATGEIIRR